MNRFFFLGSANEVMMGETGPARDLSPTTSTYSYFAVGLACPPEWAGMRSRFKQARRLAAETRGYRCLTYAGRTQPGRFVGPRPFLR